MTQSNESLKAMLNVRSSIIETFAKWTALSSLRSGAPIKSRRDVYTALNGIELQSLFANSLGPISQNAFDQWHHTEVHKMMNHETRLNTVGWAAKIINVYLKTRVYIGGEGRPCLADVIHPPIDGGLWLGLARKFRGHPEILAQTNCVRRINKIVDYNCYRRIINGCRMAATIMQCKLIEVEQLWAGTDFDDENTASKEALP